MVAIDAGRKTAAAFPAAKVESALRNELAEAARTETVLHGAPGPRDAVARGSVSTRLDSLVVVEILCAVEPILGFELSDSIVRAGGYRSADEAVAHIMLRLERVWRKRKGGGS